MQLTNDEIIEILELKHISTKSTGFSVKPNIYQISDKNNTLKKILTDNVEISVTTEEKIYKSNLKISQTLIFTIKISFILYWVLLNAIFVL